MSGIPKALAQKWKSATLDIRKTGNGRWYDQKVTPDIVAMICEVIVDYCESKSTNSFTVKDLWHSSFFEDSMRYDFGKPPPKNPKSGKEYDKVVSQPLNVLHSACILDLVKKRPKKFSVNPKFKSFLGKLAGNERGTSEFLAAYIEEVLRQSGLHNGFAAFFKQQSKDSFALIKENFCKFTNTHTGIKKEKECVRMFQKVLNIQAFKNRKRGAQTGRLSRDIISLDKIRYNRINFRDIRKPKHIPRKQQNVSATKGIPANVRTSRFVQSTIRAVKEHHAHKSEVQDQFAATPNRAGLQGHHIFSRSAYPALSCYRENIIVLSATQHAAQAHGGTTAKSYALLCLLKKLDAVKQCDNDPNCNFYSFRIFKEMLVVVGILNAKNGGRNAKTLTELSHDAVLRIIVEHYSS